jgi:hypothetical protein
LSGKPKYDYPEDEELKKLCLEHGYIKLAVMLGIPASTLQNHLRRRGIEGKKKAKAVEADPTKLPEEVSETEMLQQRVRELESQVRKDRKGRVYDERVTQAVEAAIQKAEPKYSPLAIPKAKQKHTQHEFVLDWSDLHAGEVVSLEETGGMNEYNWDIMLERHDKLRRALFSYQDNRPYPVKKLYIFALGDMLSGNIHAELEATNEIPLSEATVQLGIDGAEWIESLLERFEEIEVHGVVGNHPRAHKKPWAKQGYDNADWTAYHIMSQTLKRNKRIRFEIPKANQHRVIVAEQWANLILHFDSIRSNMPGVPWGGIMRRVAALRNQYQQAGQPVEYFHGGHFHTANAIERGRIIVNGSVKGVDEYSLKAFGGGQPPVQVLSTFHPKKGLTDVSFLDCV